MARGIQEPDHVWLVMMKAMRALTNYAAAGIGRYRARRLGFPRAGSPATQGAFARQYERPHRRSDPGSISIGVDRLVSRVESARDRRVRIVALTLWGKDLIVPALLASSPVRKVVRRPSLHPLQHCVLRQQF
jgi:MarR family 2-MHQ and catechol resistance regulon transcriptional repressor